MSALDWANWLRSGAITGPPVQRRPLLDPSMSVADIQAWDDRWCLGPIMRQRKLARRVPINRFVMIHVAATTKSADVG